MAVINYFICLVCIAAHIVLDAILCHYNSCGRNCTEFAHRFKHEYEQHRNLSNSWKYFLHIFPGLAEFWKTLLTDIPQFSRKSWPCSKTCSLGADAEEAALLFLLSFGVEVRSSPQSKPNIQSLLLTSPVCDVSYNIARVASCRGLDLISFYSSQLNRFGSHPAEQRS